MTRFTTSGFSKHRGFHICNKKQNPEGYMGYADLFIVRVTSFYSYGLLLVITGYTWDYTFYKCGYKYL